MIHTLNDFRLHLSSQKVKNVYGQKDIALAEMLLKDNNIKYRKQFGDMSRSH